MKTEQVYSDAYITMEGIIQRKELSAAELDSLLDTLLDQGFITPAEQQALLTLARETGMQR